MQAVPQASSILASLGQAAFVWDLAADTIAWSDNAGAVFTDIPVEALASGSAIARLIEPSRSIRNEALAQSAPARGDEGVAYRIEYGIRAAASAPVIWIEETGCWFAGPDGKPVRAEGIVRVNNERHARDEQLMRLSRHDPLTELPNRVMLIEWLEEAITTTQEPKMVGLVLLDHAGVAGHDLEDDRDSSRDDLLSPTGRNWAERRQASANYAGQCDHRNQTPAAPRTPRRRGWSTARTTRLSVE
jgi:hypothetical protein